MQTAMTISDKQLSTIGEYIKERIGGWINEIPLIRPQYDPALLERMVRVEEELKHQRDLMIKGFDTIDKRLETMQEQMEKRFEAVDNRFEAMQEQMNKRFEVVDKRFETMQEQMDKRFDAADKRFETMQEQMDKRFDAADKRFSELTHRIDHFMIWSLGIMISIAGICVAVLKYL